MLKSVCNQKIIMILKNNYASKYQILKIKEI